MLDLLELPNLQPTSKYDEGNEVIVVAKSRVATLQKCCLLQDCVRNGTKTMRFRDFPMQARTTWVEIARQRYKCKECKKTVYEDIPDIDPDRRVTRRFRIHLAKESVELNFTTAARITGVKETLIRRVFNDYADIALKDYKVVLPRVLGMDEIYLQGEPRFVIGDVGNRALLDIAPSRKLLDLEAYFAGCDDHHRVEVVTQDMWKPYRSITKKMFPKAVTVIDKWHVQRTANYGVEVVRKALSLSLSNEARINLKGKRTLLLARYATAKPDVQASLDRLFLLYPALETAYHLKEEFYDIYFTLDRHKAEQQMNRWLSAVPQEMERAFKPSIDALKNWRRDILRYFDHPYTNAYVERMNRTIRSMDRNGNSYTFDTLRKKMILKHGLKNPRDIYASEPETAAPPPGVTILHYRAAPQVIGKYLALRGIPLSTLEADFEAGTF